MGDVIMSGPAIRALKNTFNARITLLTSKMGSLAAPHLPEIDQLIIVDLPWIKTGQLPSPGECFVLLERLRSEKFDMAVIFTVYSQSALPAATLTYLAGIPRRLAYCRENPYHLLTDWVPDKEPYSVILHQVQRDMRLVQAVGARQLDDRLKITHSRLAKKTAFQKAAAQGVDIQKPWILLHPGVSEQKREYPIDLWIAAAALLHAELGIQLVVSGAAADMPLAEKITSALPDACCSVAGALTMDEFIAFTSASMMVISVNTATAHIAAALNRPLVVLYARTNPQHTPWKGRSEVLPFSVATTPSTRNEVLRWVTRKLYSLEMPYPTPERILGAAKKLLRLPIAKVVKI
jgi:lipopolysaccharide heptosyltransferase II